MYEDAQSIGIQVRVVTPIVEVCGEEAVPAQLFGKSAVPRIECTARFGVNFPKARAALKSKEFAFYRSFFDMGKLTTCQRFLFLHSKIAFCCFDLDEK